ncbi:MAG: Gfo/Idh/MocA family oxidoreductase [Trueperaceae bacterium]|nr:Gfo/Idh/MocA family oxidoreductase [Trueperaceae bacterium]
MTPPEGKRVRVAVVGAGVMGRYHAQNYLSLPTVELVAMVDPDPAARARARHDFACDTYSDVAALLAQRSIDAASVVTPTSTHHAVSVELLNAGVHVLVEKPVAATVEEAKDLTARSRAAGLVLQVGHITRFFRTVRMLGERVRNPYFIEARRLSIETRIKDVGVILDLMIHDIDIVLGLVPHGIDEVTVAGHTVNGGRHEDVAAAQITFRNGCIARFLASRVAPDAERCLVLAEHDQTLRVDFLREPHSEISVYRAGNDGNGGTHVRSDRHVVQEDNPLREELAHFVSRIDQDALPIGTLEDDLRSLALATRLIAQLATRAGPERRDDPALH